MALDLLYLAVAGVSWLAVWGMALGCARLQARRGAEPKESKGHFRVSLAPSGSLTQSGRSGGVRKEAA